MLTLLWSRSDFWTWLFLDVFWPLYLSWALYLFIKYWLNTTPTNSIRVKVGFSSSLALVGLFHLFVGGPRLVLSGHQRQVNSLAFSPNGRLLASGAADKTIKVWDPITGENLKTLAFMDPAPVKSLDFSPSGNTLALGGWNTITLLNVVEKKVVATLGEAQELGGSIIDAVLFSPDEKKLVAADFHSLRIWDIESGRVQTALLNEEKDFFQAEAIALSHDGKTLASGSLRGVVTIWDMDQKKWTHQFWAHGKRKVAAMEFSPDDRLLATGGNDGKVVVWQLRTGLDPKELWNLPAGSTNSLSFSSDGKWLATAGYHAGVWDIATGNLRFQVKGIPSRRFEQVRFSPDGETIAIGSSDGIIEVWNIREKEKRLVLIAEDRFPIEALAFSPRGRLLASGTKGGYLNLWDPLSGEKKYVFKSNNTIKTWPGNTTAARVEVVAFSPDGKTLAAGTSEIVNLWDTGTWQLRRNLWLGGRNAMQSLIFFPTGALFAANDGASGLWDITTGQNFLTTAQYLGTYASLSSDGNILATAPSYFGGMQVWNTKTWERLFTLNTGLRSMLFSLAFSPDGTMLAGGDGKNNLALWLTPNRQNVPNVLNKVGCGEAILSLAFSPNNKWLAAVAKSAEGFKALAIPGCIKIFRIQDNQFSFTPWRADVGGKALAFSPDSKTLAAAGSGNTIKLWRVD